MKRFFCLVIMLLLAGCGGGGSAQNGGTAPGGTDPGSTGSISLRFVEAPKNALEKAVALEPTTPGRARIVLRSKLLNFKKVVDVPFGTTMEPVSLPVASDYTIEAVFYAKGTPNELTMHGLTPTPVNVPAGGVTNVELWMAEILVALAPPTEVLSGTTYSVSEPVAEVLTGQGLQVGWSLAKSTSPFPGRVHLAQVPNTVHTNIASPIVGQQGTLYFQGEFFMKTDLLDAGESASDWSFVTEPAVPTTLKLASLTFPIDALPGDTVDPQVRSFTVPTTKIATTEISPLNIVGADNAGIAAYMITESDVQPGVNDARWSATVPTTYSYAGTVVHGSDNIVHLYAWVKDPSGRVSAAVPGVSDKIVVLNCSPVVTSFTVPMSVEFDVNDIPITIAGLSYSHGELTYLVTESPDPPALGAAWQTKPLGADNFVGLYNVHSVTPQSGYSYLVYLYAWVKDDTGISEASRNSVVISNVPQISIFTAQPVATGSIVEVSIAGVPAPGKTIEGYLVTTTSIQPAAADFLAAPPATFTYPGLTGGGATSRTVYGWVLDSDGGISQPRPVTVRFSAP